MAERDFALLTPSEPKGPSDSGQGQQNNSAGFMFPYKLASGIMQGKQGVGFSGPQIDPDNNRITVGNIVLDGRTDTISVTNTDGSSNGIGLIPGTTSERGFFSTDTDGSVSWKRIGPTATTVDLVNDKGIILDGKLPDGSHGQVIAKTGSEVDDLFS